MEKNKLLKPILKWVGGKRQLLEEIETRIPKRISYYVEPFIGGGAVLLGTKLALNIYVGTMHRDYLCDCVGVNG